MCLAELFLTHRLPEYIRSDNGPEFTAKSVRRWLENLGQWPEWQNIYVLNGDGSGKCTLTTGGGTHPAWHPHGEGLAYITPKGDLAWINKDGTGFTGLVKRI